MVKIQILTTPECGSCAKIKKMLDNMNIKYEVIDITKNPDILKKYPIMAAPGIVINGKLEFTGGMTEKQLKEKLKRR